MKKLLNQNCLIILLFLSQLCDMSGSDLDFFVSLAAESKNREIQINVIRILSTIACVMSQQNQLTFLFKVKFICSHSFTFLYLEYFEFTYILVDWVFS